MAVDKKLLSSPHEFLSHFEKSLYSESSPNELQLPTSTIHQMLPIFTRFIAHCATYESSEPDQLGTPLQEYCSQVRTSGSELPAQLYPTTARQGYGEAAISD